LAGYTVTPASINNKAGDLVVNLRDALLACHDFKAAKLDVSWNDAFLLGIGMTQVDIDKIRASFVALDKLYRISHAADTQSPATDFFFDANALTGTS
jgi:uncharacterized protein YgfB (UPF0149 family)